MSDWPHYDGFKYHFNLKPCCPLMVNFMKDSDTNWDIRVVDDVPQLSIQGGIQPWSDGERYTDMDDILFCPWCAKRIEFEKPL